MDLSIQVHASSHTHLTGHDWLRAGIWLFRSVSVGRLEATLAVAAGKHGDECVLHVGSEDEDEADGHPHVDRLGVRHSRKLKVYGISSMDLGSLLADQRPPPPPPLQHRFGDAFRLQKPYGTPYNCAPCHFMQSHIHKVHASLAETGYLHFLQNDRDLLRAAAVTAVERIPK